MRQENNNQQNFHNSRLPINEMDEKKGTFSWSGFALLEHCTRNIKRDQNLVLSPASVFAAMTMAGAGASGNTMNEFERFFGKDFIEKAKSHASVFDKILGQVIIANAIFVSGAVRTEFIKSLSDGFNAQAHQGLNKNFINSWCAKNTNRMIKDILIKELSPSTVAVIISVVYLKAKWAYPFKKSLSYKAKFNKL